MENEEIDILCKTEYNNCVKPLIRERTLSMLERGPESFTNFSKPFRSPGDHRPKYHGSIIFSENISWPLPSILVSYLRLTCSSISVIFKFQITKEVDIHNNIQKIIS